MSPIVAELGTCLSQELLDHQFPRILAHLSRLLHIGRTAPGPVARYLH